MQTTNWVYEGMWVLKVTVISLQYIFQVLYVLCFNRPRYQVSVYRTIGPLVVYLAKGNKHHHEIVQKVWNKFLGQKSWLIEPCREKTPFYIWKNKAADQSCAVTAQLISAFVFATYVVQSLFFLNQVFQASNHLLWLYSPVCVGPGRKSQRPISSWCGSIMTHCSD